VEAFVIIILIMVFVVFPLLGTITTHDFTSREYVLSPFRSITLSDTFKRNFLDEKRCCILTWGSTEVRVGDYLLLDSGRYEITKIFDGNDVRFHANLKNWGRRKSVPPGLWSGEIIFAPRRFRGDKQHEFI